MQAPPDGLRGVHVPPTQYVVPSGLAPPLDASQSVSTLQPVQPEPSGLHTLVPLHGLHASPQCAFVLQTSQVPPLLPPLHQLRALHTAPWFLQMQPPPAHMLTKSLPAQLLLQAPQ